MITLVVISLLLCTKYFLLIQQETFQQDIMAYARRSRRRTRKRKSSTRRRKYSRKRISSKRKHAMRGGEAKIPHPPPLPPLGTEYTRKHHFTKPVLPPIGYVPPTYSTVDSSIPDWRERRNTFIENTGRKHRSMSGQFHYPKPKLTPWQKLKKGLFGEKQQWPPVFM